MPVVPPLRRCSVLASCRFSLNCLVYLKNVEYACSQLGVASLLNVAAAKPSVIGVSVSAKRTPPR